MALVSVTLFVVSKHISASTPAPALADLSQTAVAGNSADTVSIASDQPYYYYSSADDTAITSYLTIKNNGSAAENFDAQFYFPTAVDAQVSKLEEKTATGWQPVSLLSGSVSRPATDAANHPISGDYVVRDRFKLSLGAGQSQHFRATIAFPQYAAGEFMVEAIGDHGGYGFLDPSFGPPAALIRGGGAIAAMTMRGGGLLFQTPTVVQTCYGTDFYTFSPPATGTCSFAVSSTIGDVLVAYTGYNLDVPTSTLLSGCVSSWNTVTTSHTGSSAYWHALLLGAVSSSTCNITTYSGDNNTFNTNIYEVSGVVTGTVDSFHYKSVFQGGTAVPGPNVTDTYAGDMALSFDISNTADTSWTVSSTPPFILDFQYNPTGPALSSALGAHLLVTGTTTPGMNLTSNNAAVHNDLMIVTLEPAVSNVSGIKFR